MARFAGVDPWQVLTWPPAQLRFNLQCLDAHLALIDRRSAQVNAKGFIVFPTLSIAGF